MREPRLCSSPSIFLAAIGRLGVFFDRGAASGADGSLWLAAMPPDAGRRKECSQEKVTAFIGLKLGKRLAVALFQPNTKSKLSQEEDE